MEPHEMAIAALSEAAQSSATTHCAGKVASPPSQPSPNDATETERDMNNVIDRNASIAQELLQPSQIMDAMKPSITGSPGTQNDSKLGQLLSMSSHNSQSTTDDHEASTPPTSTSDGFSSQGTNADGQLSQLSQLSQLAAAAQPMTNTSDPRPSLSINPTAGHKRTADGNVKRLIFSPKSPHGSKMKGHSRSTSAVSAASTTSSRIGELSSELRTRLSYAMIKVNNGWQSNSIDEVESMASQAGSPTSSTSTLHGRRNLITSPRTTIANLQGQDSILSSASTTQAPTQDFDLYSRDPSSRTYESFWRAHSTSTPHPQPSHSVHKVSLAPPADIHPSRPVPSSRRSHTPKFSIPPSIPGQGSSSSLHISTPRTPNGPGRVEYMDSRALQTPTQKTIQEQDAMEALLFMSSPGNSGNLGPGGAFQLPQLSHNAMSPQQSPLRAEFNMQHFVNRGAQGRRVGFEKAATSTDSSDAGGYQGPSQGRRKVVLGSERERSEAIDRLLDEMGSSSDEEELVVNYQSPRRVAAGRV